MAISGLRKWFVGGLGGAFEQLSGSDGDVYWNGLALVLSVVLALSYALIALRWRRYERALKMSRGIGALVALKNVLLLGCFCGYLLIPIMLIWPVWWIYDVCLLVLAAMTWWSVLRAHDLEVVYSELGRTERLAREVEAAREESRHKSFFLNALSHDLKTPLNGLMLQAELAEMNLAANDPEAVRAALHDIKSSARTTADVLDSFMEIGRLDWSDSAPVPSTVDLADSVRSVVGRHRAVAVKKGLSLRCSVPSRLMVLTHRVKLERVLSNLIDNAIKFTENGGVDVVVETRGAEVAIEVNDTGRGIAPEDQTAIFEDFVQVQNHERDSRKGFGLGLAIARRLTHQLGGELSLASVPGRGSRFTLRLGAVASEPRAAVTPLASAGANRPASVVSAAS